jgi:hypothetical protein
MKLKKYDVVITLRDPDDHTCKAEAILHQVPRESIETVKIPLKGLLEQFEMLVD